MSNIQGLCVYLRLFFCMFLFTIGELILAGILKRVKKNNCKEKHHAPSDIDGGAGW